MSATIAQARDEVFTLFRTAWLANSTSQDVELRYEDVGPEGPPTAPANGSAPPWALIQMRHAAGDQISLSGETGSRIFDSRGIITVQVFTPRGDGLDQNDALTEIARNAFEGKTTSPGGVRLRRARVLAVGEDGPWYQSNVVVDFEYDRVK
jgi:hypothetical protein